MSNSNTGLMIVVIIALIAIVFVGAYLVMGDFSSSSSSSNNVKTQTPESQNAALQNELSSLRQTNFDLSMQLSQAQSQINSLKSQNQLQYNQKPFSNTGPDSSKCKNLDDDYDNTRQDIRDKKDDISNLEDDIAAAQQRNETTTSMEDRLDNYKDDLRDLENDLDDIKDDQDRYDC